MVELKKKLKLKLLYGIKQQYDRAVSNFRETGEATAAAQYL